MLKSGRNKKLRTTSKKKKNLCCDAYVKYPKIQKIKTNQHSFSRLSNKFYNKFYNCIFFFLNPLFTCIKSNRNQLLIFFLACAYPSIPSSVVPIGLVAAKSCSCCMTGVFNSSGNGSRSIIKLKMSNVS